MKDKRFYVTTPIYYPSAKLHIGHALTTTMADTISRYKKMLGYDVFFLTGSDEHGQKIERTAAQQGLKPIQYTDRIVASFQDLWKKMDIEYTDFIRTTEDRHYQTVKKIFQKIYDKGDIYKSQYQGFYCTSCETFFTERQLEEGRCADCGKEVEVVKEESYFFQMSKYADQLIDYIEAHPHFIQPETRKNEMLSFLRGGLDDLCVSRTTFDWGIPVPIDEDHVIYVWFDALSNYLTALDYLGEGEDYQKYWVDNPEILHLVGKDIVRFHTIIWPIMLMAADIKIPDKVFAHGWLLMDGGKMSKSKGNVVDPLVLIDKYGSDAIRYFLLREVPFGEDGYYSEEALVLRTNTDLANDYGNLLSRTTSMINKFCGGQIPQADPHPSFASLAEEVKGLYVQHMDKLAFGKALKAVWTLIARGNKFIEESTPWALAKDPAKKHDLDQVMYTLAETLRVATIYLSPFMPATPAKVYSQLGLTDDALKTWSAIDFGAKLGGSTIDRQDPIFPRIDLKQALGQKEEAAKTAKQADKKKAAPRKDKASKAGAADQADQAGQNVLTIEDFFKSDLRVAEILQATKVEKTDKLLKLDLALGEKRRTIVAGIALHYTPEDLLGKKIIIVANLLPTKLRGIRSEGMLLAASSEDKKEMTLLTVDQDIASGSKVG